MIYLVPMLIGCCLMLGIRCYDQFTSSQDISFFGGGDIRFDQPAFVIVNVSADGGFTMGLMDIDPTIAFYRNARRGPYLTYPTAEAECTSTSSSNLCGAFSTIFGCEVLLDPWTNVVVGSKRANFTYRGPPTDVPVKGSYGVYTTATAYFSDTSCLVQEAVVREKGSMGYHQHDAVSGLDVVQKNTASFAVTPSVTARGWGTVANLTRNCGCGTSVTWTPGAARTITSCPANTCETPIFNDYNTPGLNSCAYVARNTTSLDGQSQSTIMFGSWNTTSTGLSSSGLKYAMTDVTATNACDAGAFTSDVGGTYTTGCSNSPTMFDISKEITLSGDFSKVPSAKGTITYGHIMYNNIGSGCQQPDQAFIIIDGAGTFLLDRNIATSDVRGLFAVNATFRSFDVTPTTQNGTDYLNDAGMGCPCGGTWQVGVKRTLYNCPGNSCPVNSGSNGLFPGVIGSTGYGVIQYNTIDHVMRLSALSTDAAKGYSMQFDEGTPLFHRGPKAPPTPPPTQHYKCFGLSGFYSCVESHGADGVPSKEECAQTCGPSQLYKCTNSQCVVAHPGSSGITQKECERICSKTLSFVVSEERL